MTTIGTWGRRPLEEERARTLLVCGIAHDLQEATSRLGVVELRHPPRVVAECFRREEIVVAVDHQRRARAPDREELAFLGLVARIGIEEDHRADHVHGREVDDGMASVDVAPGLGRVERPGDVLAIEKPFVHQVVVVLLLAEVPVSGVGIVQRHAWKAQRRKVVAASAGSARVEIKPRFRLAEPFPHAELPLNREVLGDAAATVPTRRVGERPVVQGAGAIRVLTVEPHAVAHDGVGDDAGNEIHGFRPRHVVAPARDRLGCRKVGPRLLQESRPLVDALRLVPEEEHRSVPHEFIGEGLEPFGRKPCRIGTPHARPPIPVQCAPLAVRRPQRDVPAGIHPPAIVADALFMHYPRKFNLPRTGDLRVEGPPSSPLMARIGRSGDFPSFARGRIQHRMNRRQVFTASSWSENAMTVIVGVITRSPGFR